MASAAISFTPYSGPVTQRSALLWQKSDHKNLEQASSWISSGKRGQSFREHQYSAFDVSRRCIFVGTVAVSMAARNEQHCDRSDTRHEQRIMIRAADHGNVA